jgi:hypothetical protein
MLGDRPFGNYPTKHADLLPLEVNVPTNGSSVVESVKEEIAPESLTESLSSDDPPDSSKE